MAGLKYLRSLGGVLLSLGTVVTGRVLLLYGFISHHVFLERERTLSSILSTVIGLPSSSPDFSSHLPLTISHVQATRTDLPPPEPALRE